MQDAPAAALSWEGAILSLPSLQHITHTLSSFPGHRDFLGFLNLPENKGRNHQTLSLSIFFKDLEVQVWGNLHSEFPLVESKHLIFNFRNSSGKPPCFYLLFFFPLHFSSWINSLQLHWQKNSCCSHVSCVCHCPFTEPLSCCYCDIVIP